MHEVLRPQVLHFCLEYALLTGMKLGRPRRSRPRAGRARDAGGSVRELPAS